uniref:Uncharacterized protein n=1 Tax=Hyaloperonospora arabidopsidis (strain Emoy2) TaxID=559515 RepID=M4C348_HYAAE
MVLMRINNLEERYCLGRTLEEKNLKRLDVFGIYSWWFARYNGHEKMIDTCLLPRTKRRSLFTEWILHDQVKPQI